MRLSPEHRIAILLHEGIRGSQGKTGLSLLRYSDANIVAVIDQQCAGESLPDLTGIHRTAPIVARARPLPDGDRRTGILEETRWATPSRCRTC